MAFDEESGNALHEDNVASVGETRALLEAAAGPEAAGTNWSSPVQVRNYFRTAGIDLPNTEAETLAKQDHPVAKALVAYRKAMGAVEKIGSKFARVVDGRIYPAWWQIGARTGRMSCSKPNMQGIPRAYRYRRCFAPPDGRVAIKGDYSQIEARLAARYTGDRRLLEAFEKGLDVYEVTAKSILGKDGVSKEDRNLAKAVCLGLIYGMGAPRLQQYARESFGVILTPEQAVELREAFFGAHPGLRAWHLAVKKTLRHGEMPEARTLTGRRRLFTEGASFSEIVNLPIQGSGADGLKAALALLWERRSDCPDAFPVSVVHDEITVEAPEDRAEEAKAWLVAAMEDGMRALLDPVPVIVETSVLRRGKP